MKNFENQDFFKAKLMIAGIFNLMVLNSLNILLTDFSNNQLYLSVLNVFVWIFLLIFTLNTNKIDNSYKIMTIYGIVSTSLHALLSSGIYSSYIFWFPIICLGMSIFLNRTYAIISAIYSMFCITLFFLLQIYNIIDFKYQVTLVPIYFDYINIMSILSMLSLILYFSFTKENLDFFWKKEKEEKIEVLQDQLVQRTREIRKMRNDMAIEFHDEMGNKLALISTYINVLQLQNLGQNNKLKEYLDQINTNAKAVYEGTRDFIWTIEAEHANFYELGVYIRDFGERIFLPVDVDFISNTLQPQLKTVKTSFVENHQIILIAKEAMTNALKHSKSHKVELIFNIIEDKYVELSIKDYGDGFDKTKLNRINGISNMEKRADKINAKLDVITDKDKGVIIKLKYKINKSN